MTLLPSEKDRSRHDGKERECCNITKVRGMNHCHHRSCVARSTMEHQQRVAVCWLVKRELVKPFHSLSCLPGDYSPTPERAVRLEHTKDVKTSIASSRSNIIHFVSVRANACSSSVGNRLRRTIHEQSWRICACGWRHPVFSRLLGCTFTFTAFRLSVDWIKQSNCTYRQKTLSSKHLASQRRKESFHGYRLFSFVDMNCMHSPIEDMHNSRRGPVCTRVHILSSLYHTHDKIRHVGKRSNGRQTQKTSILKIWRLKRRKAKRRVKKNDGEGEEESLSTAHTQTLHREQQWTVCSIDP